MKKTMLLFVCCLFFRSNALPIVFRCNVPSLLEVHLFEDERIGLRSVRFNSILPAKNDTIILSNTVDLGYGNRLQRDLRIAGTMSVDEIESELIRATGRAVSIQRPACRGHAVRQSEYVNLTGTSDTGPAPILEAGVLYAPIAMYPQSQQRH